MIIIKLKLLNNNTIIIFPRCTIGRVVLVVVIKNNIHTTGMKISCGKQQQIN